MQRFNQIGDPNKKDAGERSGKEKVKPQTDDKKTVGNLTKQCHKNNILCLCLKTIPRNPNKTLLEKDSSPRYCEMQGLNAIKVSEKHKTFRRIFSLIETAILERG